jgi:hypothetical protein
LAERTGQRESDYDGPRIPAIRILPVYIHACPVYETSESLGEEKCDLLDFGNSSEAASKQKDPMRPNQ